VTAGALRWLEDAGWRALAAGEPREAERWFTGGLDLSADGLTTAQCLFGRAKARCEMRDIAGTRSDLDRLDPLAQLDSVLGARALALRGDVNQKAGELDRAAGELREAADRLDALDQPADHSLALRLLGITEMARGDETMALQALTSARAVAAAAGIRNEEAWALQNLAWFAFRSGRVNEASRLVKEAEVIFTELDDPGGLAWTRTVEAWVAFHGGHWDRARELVAEILPETRRRGDPFAETVMLSLETSMALWSGEAVRAVELAREAQALAERADDFTLAVQARALEGRALISCGRVSEGLAALEQAFNLADRAGDDESRRIAVISNCAAAARLGDAERAIRWAARFEGTHSDLTIVGESDLSVSLALALLQRGSVDEAASQISWVSSFESELAGMYAQAVGAIVAAARGDVDAARAKADVVLAGRSTYLDRLLTLLALTALAAQEHDEGGIDERLAAAREHLARTDDLISPLFVELVAAVCGRGSMTVAEESLRALGVDPIGWRTAWTLAARPGSIVVD
jgi:tetratricopeptide (TPR) repeat protein